MADDLETMTKEQQKSAETVTIPSETLQRLLDRLDQYDKDIRILRDSVSQGKLLDAENKDKPNELPKAYLKIFNGKLVVGWKSVKAETLYHPSNPDVPVGEILRAIYTYSDGSQSEITDQVLFTRCEDRAIFSILEGKEALRTPNLKEVTLRFEKLITSDEDLQNSFVAPQSDFKININLLNP